MIWNRERKDQSERKILGINFVINMERSFLIINVYLHVSSAYLCSVAFQFL